MYTSVYTAVLQTKFWAYLYDTDIFEKISQICCNCQACRLIDHTVMTRRGGFIKTGLALLIPSPSSSRKPYCCYHFHNSEDVSSRAVEHDSAPEAVSKHEASMSQCQQQIANLAALNAHRVFTC